MEHITQERLIQAGWKKDRTIDIKHIEKEYLERGIVVPDNVKEFLKEFGMLKINFEKEMTYVKINEVISFNPIEALGKNLDKDYFDSIVEDYTDFISEELFPIGNAARGNLILMMTCSNKVYSFTDGCFCKNGNNIEEMLDCVVGECMLPTVYE